MPSTGLHLHKVEGLLDRAAILSYIPWVAHKPKPPPDDPEQLKRFIDMAREVEVDESEGATDRAFRRVVRPKREREGIKRTPHSPNSRAPGEFER
jgi:hypothetical protein